MDSRNTPNSPLRSKPASVSSLLAHMMQAGCRTGTTCHGTRARYNTGKRVRGAWGGGLRAVPATSDLPALLLPVLPAADVICLLRLLLPRRHPPPHTPNPASLIWYRGSLPSTTTPLGARCVATCCRTCHLRSRVSVDCCCCCLSSSYLRLQSSYSCSSSSWNILRTLTVSPCTAGFQWLAVFSSSAGSTSGSNWCRCCATRLTMYSLFQRKSDRSATWKC
mmetsp:Transcript_12392/g.30425  ORF Transcript_12392/g.30425 Transcript_12392/m.30425 type:complete len:221 (-) Transcript_12392:1269-1931(-)